MERNGFITSEFRQLFKKKSVLISVIIALLVPLVYAMIVLSPKWGPYDNIDNLPVAVVNNDEGATSNGQRINIGEQLVDSLQENRALGWDFVSAEEADRGMENLKYYMVIEVPEDFSEKAVTVMDDNPERPELNFIQNEGLHFMAAQVTKNAIELVKSQLSASITETYVKNVFDQLGEVGEGFQDAADGAEQINDGAGQLKDGSEEILTALTDKSGDIGRLADGAHELNEGTRTMRDSLVSKQGDISRLAAGANELNAGTGELLSNLRGKSGDIKKLADGANQLHAGTTTLRGKLVAQKKDIKALSDGANKVKQGSTELNEGASQVLEGLQGAKLGSGQLAEGLKGVEVGSAQLAAGIKQAQDNVGATMKQINELKENLKSIKDHFGGLNQNLNGALEQMIFELESSLNDAPSKMEQFDALVLGANNLSSALSKEGPIVKGISGLDDGLGKLVIGQNKIVDGSKQLEVGSIQLAEGNAALLAGWDTLIAGVSELDSGANQIATGNQTVHSGWNELAAGAEQLHAGSTKIADGNRTVEVGWRELAAGATQLHDGSSQIADGNQTVKEGWDTLTDGVSQVDDGLSQLVDGSDELKTGLQGGAERTSEIDPAEENIAMFAEPVVLSGEVINSFPFYRDSNAPYILTLALYVGILVMSFVVAYEKPATLPSSPVVWFIGKVSKLSALAIAQALIISLYSLLILKIEVQSALAFVLYSLFVSLTFLMIILFLIVLAGNIGRFIALAFVVLQLSTTGSALPVHMLPEGLRNLSVFLPFTYSINGYRNIITLGNSSEMWSSISVLFIYFLVFAGLSLAVFFFKYRSLRANHVHEIEEAV